MKVPAAFQSLLRCATCGAAVVRSDASIVCTATDSHCFPVVDGVPVMIDEARSAFTLEEFREQRPTFFKPRNDWLRRLDATIPGLARNVGTKSNFRTFLEHLPRVERRRILVLGGSILGTGMDIVSDAHIELLETDISFGPRTQLIADAHCIPLASGSMDGVICQAVLEHVIDPAICVSEIHRVLKPGGVLYAEVPFMQPVHGGRYDFTRFSHAGLRWLFRRFEERDSGAVCGPGSSLAYSFTYFLQSHAIGGFSRRIANRVGRLLAGWLPLLDQYLVRRDSSLDSASSLYFCGSRSETTLTRRELLEGYRGGTYA